jgi:hypothetical protein
MHSSLSQCHKGVRPTQRHSLNNAAVLAMSDECVPSKQSVCRAHMLAARRKYVVDSCSQNQRPASPTSAAVLLCGKSKCDADPTTPTHPPVSRGTRSMLLLSPTLDRAGLVPQCSCRAHLPPFTPLRPCHTRTGRQASTPQQLSPHAELGQGLLLNGNTTRSVPQVRPAGLHPAATKPTKATARTAVGRTHGNTYSCVC